MTYVIVGNGVASVGAIEGIRKHDAEGKILVVTEEDSLTYGRPLISYLLAGKIGPDRLSLRPDDFYEKNNVEIKLSTKVVGLDTDKKNITTMSGGVISYDKLLMATGGTPFIPPIKGVQGRGVYSFTTLAHAEALMGMAAAVNKVVVIGGGLIGLKAAEGLFDRGLDVTVVELAPRILSAAFDDDAGALVGKQLADTGLKLVCGASAQEIVRDAGGHITGVALSTGETLDCEAVVVAIGVAPNLEVAKSGELAINRGLKVNEYLQTSAEDVYGAGDVAEARDMLVDEDRVTPIWPNAYRQGYYAGFNMAGKKSEFAGGVAMNSISFYGMPTASVGIVNPPADEGYEVFTDLDQEKKTYRKLVFRDGLMVGYVLVGNIDLAGLYTGFVRFQIPIKPEVKAELKSGTPSSLLWPEEFFDQRWNPDIEDVVCS